MLRGIETHHQIHWSLGVGVMPAYRDRSLHIAYADNLILARLSEYRLFIKVDYVRCIYIW